MNAQEVVKGYFVEHGLSGPNIRAVAVLAALSDAGYLVVRVTPEAKAKAVEAMAVFPGPHSTRALYLEGM